MSSIMCKIKPAVLMQSEVYQSRDPQPNTTWFMENKALQKHQKASLQFYWKTGK